MMHRLDDRFTLSSDKYNWILIDKQNGKKERRHYFANVKQLSNFIGELKLREGLDRCEVNLCKNSHKKQKIRDLLFHLLHQTNHS